MGGVVVTDFLPAAAAFITSTPPANATNGNDYSFNLGTLTTGAVTSITISVSITSSVPGVITNRATVSTTNLEVNLTNNQDAATTILPDSDNDGLANPGDPDDVSAVNGIQDAVSVNAASV